MLLFLQMKQFYSQPCDVQQHLNHCVFSFAQFHSCRANSYQLSFVEAHGAAMPRWSAVSQAGASSISSIDILSQTQVYVLCIPSRKEHAASLMTRWGFHAQLVDGPDKSSFDLQRLISAGVVLPEYLDVVWQDVEYFPEGKVACHLGHLNILERFLAQREKLFALIFEDDLEAGPESLREDLSHFLSQVPQDFDLLHLGFVRESRAARQPVNTNGSVFRSVEALGRHAYVVTRKVAELLVKHTLPMYNHGDKMFQAVYHQFRLKAYQPEEPLFFQDRINFESELTERWKPSRAFQPTAEDDGIRSCDRPEMLRRQKMKQAQSRWPCSNSALFLNVDGVLNMVDSAFSVSTCGRPEQCHLTRLAKVMKQGCCLVLTSRWRLDERYCGRLASALVRSGIPGQHRPCLQRLMARAMELTSWNSGSWRSERGWRATLGWTTGQLLTAGIWWASIPPLKNNLSGQIPNMVCLMNMCRSCQWFWLAAGSWKWVQLSCRSRNGPGCKLMQIVNVKTNAERLLYPAIVVGNEWRWERIGAQLLVHFHPH